VSASSQVSYREVAAAVGAAKAAGAVTIGLGRLWRALWRGRRRGV